MLNLNIPNIPNILPFHGLFSGLRPSQVEFIGKSVSSYKGYSNPNSYKVNSEEKKRLDKMMEKMPVGTILEADHPAM